MHNSSRRSGETSAWPPAAVGAAICIQQVLERLCEVAHVPRIPPVPHMFNSQYNVSDRFICVTWHRATSLTDVLVCAYYDHPGRVVGAGTRRGIGESKQEGGIMRTVLLLAALCTLTIL